MKKSLLLVLAAIVCSGVGCSQKNPNTDSSTVPVVTLDTLAKSDQTVLLPEPYATKSVTNFSEVIGWGDNMTPTVPNGFTVTAIGKDFMNPRWIYVLPNGDVLIAETKMEPKGMKKVISKVSGMSKAGNSDMNANRITLLRDADKDGKYEMQKIFMAGLNLPFGMLLMKGYFYVANTDAVWRYPYKEGETNITAKGEKIMDLPSAGRHWTKNIIGSADGTKIYVAVGSSSNVAEDGIEKENMRACIIEANADGSSPHIYASGLRNPVGMAWQPGTNTLWTAVNERDELGDELVPDYLTSVRKDGFYGWPYSYFGQHVDPRIKDKDQRPDLVKAALMPDVALGSHTASLGLAFYDKGNFPAQYKNGAFIGQHGSWNRSAFSGYKVIYIPFENNKAGKAQDFVTGFIANEGEKKVYGRPVGVAVAADGALLVADDAGNKIWRVSASK